MLGKRVTILGLCLVFIGLLMVASYGQVQAADKTGPVNDPPACYPILFYVGGYWGMSCIDDDNNISAVHLKTDGEITYLYWDNSNADMIVHMEGKSSLSWAVCDSFDACTGGTYP